MHRRAVVAWALLPYGEALGYRALTTALREAAGITSESDSPASRRQLGTGGKVLSRPRAKSDPVEIGRHLALLGGLGKPEDARLATPPTKARCTLGAAYFSKPGPSTAALLDGRRYPLGRRRAPELIEFVAGRGKDAPLLILDSKPALACWKSDPTWGAGVRAFTSFPCSHSASARRARMVLALCRERGLTEAVAIRSAGSW